MFKKNYGIAIVACASLNIYIITKVSVIEQKKSISSKIYDNNNKKSGQTWARRNNKYSLLPTASLYNWKQRKIICDVYKSQ